MLGVPAIFYMWRADAKWPNPFALQTRQKAQAEGNNNDR